MTSAEIRRSFLDFFRSKEHTIVASSSLLPDSPNLLFTNAGMNQFVPIFLGTTPCPYAPPRAADTQKCIRAGGKHNDLEDVGLDTYHHTFFEMLGNWSFGDYFKKEAIAWAWELLVDVWKFPPERLYATVYQPADGDPASFDAEAHAFWSELFLAKGLDPAIHIVPGNKKDNFWMMGETGPCGPCSELHVDLTQNGDTKGALVNKGSSECIEIWNLVFIQFNANPDGTFVPLPACHVDTGMGFERVTSIMQCTKNFTDFGTTISNYETDIFRPLFDAIGALSGKKYHSTLPRSGTTGQNDQEKEDVAFRVIADHIRTLSFAIADGIQPGNTERHYVLRRILRRAVRYGRTLGLTQPFLHRLATPLAALMGEAFPELIAKEALIIETLKREEEAFHKTLAAGLELFEKAVGMIDLAPAFLKLDPSMPADISAREYAPTLDGKPGQITFGKHNQDGSGKIEKLLSGEIAFKLYDEQGFPLDLTELLARERGLKVDTAGFEVLMEAQRARARTAQKKEIISVQDTGVINSAPTEFVGYDLYECESAVLGSDRKWLIADKSPLYTEMGGQVGDIGYITHGDKIFTVKPRKAGTDVIVHWQESDQPFDLHNGDQILIRVDAPRRAAIQRHHSVTHLLHWALREVLGETVSQKGSFVGPDKLTFDFSSSALTPEQLEKVELCVNERILENASVSWQELPFTEVKGRPGILQFFGDKYGDLVRVVQIGGTPGALDGYSMELCGGTHVRATGEIGSFRIVSESAVAAGVRRIEAIAGLEARNAAKTDAARLHHVASRLGAPMTEIEKKLEATLSQLKGLEKELETLRQREAAGIARELLLTVTSGPIPSLVAELPNADGNQLQAVADAIKSAFDGVIVLAGVSNDAVSLVAVTGKPHQSALPAGKIISAVAPLVGGKGGGKPDSARGGGRDATGLSAALEKARELIAAGKI